MVNGKLEIFPVTADGCVQQKAESTLPVRLVAGRAGTVCFDAKELGEVTASYLLRLTAGTKGEYTAEYRSRVNAWDLIGCFSDPVTEEEKREIDKAEHEVPDGYCPDGDPYFDDEAEDELNPYPYSSGVNPATVTAKQIAVKAWYWDQNERDAKRLCITNGVASYQISPEDWQRVWGNHPEKKKLDDDEGAAVYSLNGVFFTTNPGQFITVKMAVARNGAMDNAGNPFDADEKTPEREGTITDKITIDEKGNVSGKLFNAVPHKDASAYRSSSQQPKPRKLTRFEKFYPIYREHIAEIWAEGQKRESAFYREQLSQGRQTERTLVGHEDEWIVKLRESAARSRHNRLEFDGEAPENLACMGFSDASERIFARLIKDNLASPEQVLGRISHWAELMSPSWIAFVKDTMKNSEPHSALWRRCLELLCRARADEETYRPECETIALAGDEHMLYALFFSRDRKTGLPQVRQSAANDALMEKLAGEKSKPGVRAVCAAYAAACGKTALAESIGADVCNMRYACDKHPASHKADDELFAARNGVGYYPGILSTLFYQVRTEKAFRIILERSDIYRARRFDKGKIPPEWEHLGDDSPGRWELETADGMIFALKNFQSRRQPKDISPDSKTDAFVPTTTIQN